MLYISTTGREDETIIPDIGTKEDCSVKCKLNGNCKVWTWFNGNAGINSFKCILMSKYGELDWDLNAVTADKDCNIGKFLVAIWFKMEFYQFYPN